MMRMIKLSIHVEDGLEKMMVVSRRPMMMNRITSGRACLDHCLLQTEERDGEGEVSEASEERKETGKLCSDDDCASNSSLLHPVQLF